MNHFQFSKRGLLLAFSALAALVVVACGGGGQEAATPDGRAMPLGLGLGSAITWSPASIIDTANPGSRQDIPVTFKTAVALKDVTVSVAELNEFITVNPTSFTTLEAGQTATVTITVAPPAGAAQGPHAALGTMDGTIHLRSGNSTIARPLPVTLTLVLPELINGIAVPPEPPAALNNATLAGFDANGNGVRDDVERYIALTYPQSAKARAGLTQYAKSIQFLVVGGGTQAAYLKAINDSLDCLSATFMTSEGDVTGGLRVAATSRALKSSVLNTSIRVKSYATANMLLSGTITPGTSFQDQSARCSTAPSLFPN